MEFADKFDLLESITSGAVETFIANDKGRGERVLVHILHCEPQRPNQPTVQWVLENFRKVAPEPAGLVIETGKYSGTLYAYLVTKLPDEVAVKNWVRQYKSQAADTREIPAAPSKPAPEAKSAASEHPTEEIPAQEPAHVPVQFTQIFREFGSQPKATPPVADAEQPEPPLRAVPTLGDPGHPSALHFAPDWDVITPEKPVLPKADPVAPKTVPSAEDPESSFSAQFAVNRFPTEVTTPAVKDSAKPGEFTSFFQGPFRPDVPAELPPVVSTPVEPRQKPVGTFTEMFGAVTAKPEPPLVSSGFEKKTAPGTGFTGWFSDPDILSRNPETPVPTPPPPRSATDAAPVVPSPSKKPLLGKPQPLPPPPPVAAAPPVFPVPTPVLAKPQAAVPIPSAPDGAARAFSMASSEPMPVQPAPLSGPSPYTQVISMRSMAASDVCAAESTAKSPGSSAAAPKFPEVKPPAAPKVQAPATPKMPTPPGVKAPKLDSPKPPVSFWPLVITLTVLFCLAVLLVLYFVLKH